MLFSERGLTGVLDFHHAAAGYWIYDLAVVANDWCNDSSGVLDSDRTLALLRAYHAIRPLTPAEIWYFPMFALYAATAFWLSRLTVAMRRTSEPLVRFNNPEEFQRIVEQHTRAFLLSGLTPAGLSLNAAQDFRAIDLYAIRILSG